jgi:hypothetical protein
VKWAASQASALSKKLASGPAAAIQISGKPSGMASNSVMQAKGIISTRRVPHPYARADVYGESSDGPGGTASTTVYPVSGQYTVRKAYRDAFLTYQYDERYSCFKNSFGKWECNATSGGKGMIKQFREERAS